MTRQLIPALLLVGLTACAAVDAGRDIPGCHEGPCVAVNETQDLGAVQVTPLDVIEDSRCPIEAECIWAGRVRIIARIENRGGVIEDELESWKPQVVAGGTLELVEVAPDASGQWPDLAPGDYRFRFSYVPAIMQER